MLRIVGSETQPGAFIGDMHQLVNSRYISFTIRETELPSIVWIFWNLQTLIVRHLLNERITAPSDIWHMPNIRHLYINNLSLSDPPNDRDCIIVLENLQTMDMVRNFRCSEQVVKRIPNIRRLVLSYHEACDDDKFRLTNLARLGKLETLLCTFYESMCQINYPQSLKKLIIAAPRKPQGPQHWQDTLDKIGALPLLQKLCLYNGTFEGRWETIEGEFRSLKYLSLTWCGGLQAWTTDASYFPRLEHLRLDRIPDLKEIPSDFGEIPTLKLIEMYRCSDSAIESAKRILEEQEALCGEEDTTLQIRVELQKDTSPAQESLRSRNFHLQFDVDYNCIDVDFTLDLDLDC